MLGEKQRNEHMLHTVFFYLCQVKHNFNLASEIKES